MIPLRAMPEDPRPESRWRWFAGALVIAAYAGFYRIRTFDTFFHLAAGRYIAERGEVPTTDPFSYSFPDATWHDHSWGFQWLTWQLFDATGYTGLVAAVTTLSVVLLALGAMRLALHRAYLVPWALVPFAFFRDVLCPRPHTYGLLGLAALLVVLEVAQRRRRPALVWVGVGIHAVWVTMHGSHLLFIPCLLVYAAALAIAGRGATDETTRAALRQSLGHLAGVVVAGLAVTALLAPDAVSLGFEHVGPDTLRRYIPEWKPLTLADVAGTWAGRAALALGILSVSGAVLTWGRNRIHATAGEDDADEWIRAGVVARLAVFAAFTVLALTSRWMLALWLFGVMPLWMEFADASLRALGGRLENLARLRPQLALVGLAMICLGVFEIAGGKTYVPGAGLDERRAPAGALTYLEHRPDLPFSRPFHAYNYGGYIMLVRPETRVLIDGRAITVYPPEFMERFVGIYDDPPRFEAFASEYDIDAVLLPLDSRRTGKLRIHIDQSPEWTSVYRDRVSELWVATKKIPPVRRPEGIPRG